MEYDYGGSVIQATDSRLKQDRYLKTNVSLSLSFRGSCFLNSVKMQDYHCQDLDAKIVDLILYSCSLTRATGGQLM